MGTNSSFTECGDKRHEEISGLLKRQTELKGFHFSRARACLKAETPENRVVKNTQEQKKNQKITEDRELALGLERHYDQV